MISDVVFDFDGTLADSRAVVVALYNQIARDHGYPLMQASDLERLRGLSIRERCRVMGIPLYRLPSLVVEANRRYKQFAGTVEPYAGIVPLLQVLHGRGLRLGIISSNTPETIRGFLARNGVEALVECVECSSNLFGKDRVMARYLKRFQRSPAQVLYVGDEHRDVVAWKKVGLKGVAVTWGMDSVELLSRAEPDFIAHQPEDILRRVEHLIG